MCLFHSPSGGRDLICRDVLKITQSRYANYRSRPIIENARKGSVADFLKEDTPSWHLALFSDGY